MGAYPKLYSPLKLQGVTLKNRIVAAAMTLNWASNEGIMNDQHVKYYLDRARGGVGLLTFEATSINSSRRSANNRTPAIYSDDFIPGFRKIIDQIHTEDTPVFLQLHDGLMSTRRIPTDLTVEEVQGIRNDFVNAARRAKEAGFDGIEIHMVHRGTLADFLSKKTNLRTDEYGGSVRGRAKLASEVVSSIKEAVGDSFPVVARILGDEFLVGGNTPKDSAIIAAVLESSGADSISLSAGGRTTEQKDSLTKTLPDEYSFWRAWPTAEWPDATNAYLGEEIKKVVRIPVMVAGKIGSPDVAEGVLRTGKADLIAMGRALVSDPHLPIKIFEGNWEGVVKCKYCRYCRQEVRGGRELSCILWKK